MDSQRVTVLGGTGKTGGRVVAELNAYGHRVRAASRGSATPFDWDAESSWSAVLAGADAVYLVPREPLGGNGRLVAFARHAADSGVKRLVPISAREWVETGLDEGLEREDIVRSAGTGWTVLRPVWFAQDFSEETFLSDGITRGELVFGTGDGRHPFVDAEDIAAVAVAALTSDTPRSVLRADRTTRHHDRRGRRDDCRGAQRRSEPAQPAAKSTGVTSSSTTARRTLSTADDARLSDGVQRAIGRQPRDFADFARGAAAAGAWASPW